MSEAPDRVVQWYGRPVDEMTRDELMEAFQQVCRMHRDSLTEHVRQFRVLDEFRAARERRIVI